MFKDRIRVFLEGRIRANSTRIRNPAEKNCKVISIQFVEEFNSTFLHVSICFVTSILQAMYRVPKCLVSEKNKQDDKESKRDREGEKER